MKILAIDDEKLSLGLLKKSIEEVSPDSEIFDFSNPSELLQFAETTTCDVAFLDIQMRTMTGIQLAKKLKEINPHINIIFVTGYSEYMPDAFDLRVSGYILKPATKEKVARELEDLRHPVATEVPHIRIQTFGHFEVFIDGKPLQFSRSKPKELLAYLVDRKGASITTAEIGGLLWEDKEYSRSIQKQTQTVISQLVKILNEYGIGDIFIHRWNSMSVDRDKFQCDLYDFINGKVSAINAYTGEYMTNYSWAELTAGSLTRISGI